MNPAESVILCSAVGVTMAALATMGLVSDLALEDKLNTWLQYALAGLVIVLGQYGGRMSPLCLVAILLAACLAQAALIYKPLQANV